MRNAECGITDDLFLTHHSSFIIHHSSFCIHHLFLRHVMRGNLKLVVLFSVMLWACADARAQSANEQAANATPTPAAVEAVSAPAVQWQLKTGGSIYAPPLVADGTVYFGSYDYNVYAADAATGRERWRAKTGGRVIGAPVLADGVLYFGSQDNKLYALDAATGQVKWKFKTELAIVATPMVAHNTVFVAGTDGSLYAVDAATGKQKWTFAVQRGTPTAPVLLDGLLFVGNAVGVQALAVQDGKQ